MAPSSLSSVSAAALAPNTAPAPALPFPSWRVAWARPAFWRQLAAALGGITVVGSVTPAFFAYVQNRPGFLLPDPLLALLPARDVSALAFGALYGGVFAALAFLVTRPALLLRGLWAYLFLLVLRLLVLALVPLEAPPHLVPLHDPIMDRYFYAAAGGVTKDLFFSGHTATATLLALAVRGRWWRWALGLAAVAVGVLVLVQHVHYSLDVLAAPFFAWLAYRLAGAPCRRVPWAMCPATPAPAAA